MDIFKDYECEGQMSIFDFINADKPFFKITNKIRLIELFAGVGSQSMALRDLGVDFEHYRVVEFDKYAIASYNAIHGTNFETTDIKNVKGIDLGIVDKSQFTYLLTYSFPCTDLSVAGKMLGMEEGSGTRSSLLWEVKRLLDETPELPQVLLMENVPQVHGKNNKDSFDKWLKFLEGKGYTNYYQDLNAKDYGVAQSRNRCFCVSILGNYRYEFPKHIPLFKRMKHYLEEKVADSFYLNNDKAKDLIDKLIINGKILNRTEQNRTEQNRTEQNRTEQNRLECLRQQPMQFTGLGSSSERYIAEGTPADVAATLLARDYKGLGNYASNGVCEWKQL